MKYFRSCKPYTRWWWFSVSIEKSAIRYQLDWAKENNFGGVEIAFVYPLQGEAAGQKFLSRDWSSIVKYTKDYCNKINLGCDFTLGSLWPFGGSFVSKEHSSRVYYGYSKQRILYSWEHNEYPEGVRILNHLSKKALDCYFNKIGNALKPALKDMTSSLFCDSWEVETEGLWTNGFEKMFLNKYGYDILKYIKDIDKNINARYDYRKLISDLVLDFYKNYTDECHQLKSHSRVQCHGAPTDLISAYSLVDIPESEAILFDSDFSSIPASSAALSGKKIISCESFTCLYGWAPRPGPAPHSKEELVTDLKLLADSLFANGINQIIWHGMPYSPEKNKKEFYATVHVGPDGKLSPHFKYFNRYLEKISKTMSGGKTYSDVAVYLPYEDMLMLNKLPRNKRKPSAVYYWEMQYMKFPEELRGYHPLWINERFIKKSAINNKNFLTGDCSFSLLYVYSKWLDLESLKSILNLARNGVRICLKYNFKEPGKIKHKEFAEARKELLSYKNVTRKISEQKNIKPLAEGRNLPEFRCRKQGGNYFIFFANPDSKGLTYPMEYGCSLKTRRISRNARININGKSISLKLNFGKHESILLKIDKNLKVTKLQLARI